jgi:hypothetical protein
LTKKRNIEILRIMRRVALASAESNQRSLQRSLGDYRRGEGKAAPPLPISGGSPRNYFGP